MNKDDLKQIINDAKERNLNIKIRDIAFVLLKYRIEDDNICYSSLFGLDFTNEELDEYINSEKIEYLIDLLKPKKATITAKKNIDTITFDENRASMEKDLRDITKFLDENKDKLDPKEYSSLIKTKADLSVKLNDKFGASEKKDEQRIIVMHKSDCICDHLQRECPLDKITLMKMFNLKENK